MERLLHFWGRLRFRLRFSTRTHTDERARVQKRANLGFRHSLPRVTVGPRLAENPEVRDRSAVSAFVIKRSTPVSKQPNIWVRKPWTVYLAIGTLAALYLFPFVRVLWRNGDEGIELGGAHLVLQGQIPSRDFFVPMGPGSFYWLAAFFKIFGESIETSRGLLLLTGVALTLLTLYCTRRISTLAALPVLFTTIVCLPFSPVTSHHWDSNLFALAAFAILLAWQDSRRPAALIASGALAGVCCCIFQPKGILMFGALVVTVCLLERRHRLRSISTLLISFAFVPVVLCCFYASQGALGDLYANFLWPVMHYEKVGRVPYAFGFAEYYWRTCYTASRNVFGSPWAFLASAVITGPFLVVLALPGLLAAAIAVLRRRAFSKELVPFWLCGAALWLSEMHRPDLGHLVFGCSIWFILLCALLGKIRLSRGPAFLLAPSLIALGSLNFTATLRAATRIETRRGVIYGFKGEPGLAFLIAHTTQGEPAFIYPYSPIYYFLSGTENATRFSFLLYGFNTPDQFRSAIEGIESKRVRYILWDTRVTEKDFAQWFPAYIPPSQKDQIMENYLNSHYHEVGLEGDFRMLKRNE
jgi:hypothetical protein